MRYGLSALLAATLFLSLPAAPLAALNADDYFSITYEMTFSTQAVAEGQVFSVSINGQAVCIQDLPLEPTEVIITGRIVAQHQSSGATVTLNPGYTVTISPFPHLQGQSASSTQLVSLQFPAGSQPGEYIVSGELLQAKLRAGLLFDVTGYLPPTENMGSVGYQLPPPPPEPQPPQTPAEPEPAPEVPESPPDTSVPPALFNISNPTQSAAEVSQGGIINVSALASNTGGTAGEYEVVIKLDGQVVETRRLTLESGASQTVSFTLTAGPPGSHSFSINDLSGIFTVSSPTDSATPPEKEAPGAGQEIDDGGFSLSTIVYLGDGLLAGVIVWLVLKRRRAQLKM